MKDGHLFVVRGDITRLACDHWLLPTDAAFTIEPGWREAIPGLGELCDESGRLGATSGWNGRRVRRLSELAVPNGQPQPWLADVGSVPGEQAEWYADGAREFVRAARDASVDEPAAYGRARPLLALPLIGTGAGGGSGIKGAVLDRLVAVLDAEAIGVDIVLVTRNDAALHAAQIARSRAPGAVDRWTAVAASRNDAEALAREARAGRLVAFVGAGASRNAGMPLWSELLAALAGDAELPAEDATAFDQLGLLDQARVLESRLGGRAELSSRIAEQFKGGRPALAHCLLAGLPIQELATTNYDQLLEIAAEGSGRPVAVLPWEPAGKHGGRWLLKLHGSVDHPADIVLTRDDYLRYGERRAALAGIVQALLITRHMVFVGFSLEDDNFHRILHEVRNAVGDPEQRPSGTPFGTVLSLSDRPLARDVWRGDLRFLSFSDASAADSARRLEIFLDLLLSETADPSAYLLDPSFDALLDPAERELREAIGRVAELIADERLAERPLGRAARDLVARFGQWASQEFPAPGAAPAHKGSRRRMQDLVERRATWFEQRLLEEWPSLREQVSGPVVWLSPLARDRYRELRDDLWSVADLPDPTPQAAKWWPRHGPVWDGVARVPTRAGHGVLLVEAKSHADELKSPGTSASPRSAERIAAALDETKRALGVDPAVRWDATYYQVANRLAFLHYLRRRGVPAWLLFVYFVGDRFETNGRVVTGPTNARDWQTAIDEAHRALALPSKHPYSPFVHDMFLDV